MKFGIPTELGVADFRSLKPNKVAKVLKNASAESGYFTIQKVRFPRSLQRYSTPCGLPLRRTGRRVHTRISTDNRIIPYCILFCKYIFLCCTIFIIVQLFQTAPRSLLRIWNVPANRRLFEPDSSISCIFPAFNCVYGELCKSLCLGVAFPVLL